MGTRERGIRNDKSKMAVDQRKIERHCIPEFSCRRLININRHSLPFPIGADGFNGTSFQRLTAQTLFVWISWLFVNERVTLAGFSGKVVRSDVAANITIDAL
jgi:hypothetical protein